MTEARNEKDRIRLIILCCLLGVSAEIFSSHALGFILEAIPGAAEKYMSDVSQLLADNMRMILLVSVIAPIIEELVFRLFMLGLLKRFLPFIVANLLQAVLFGIYHGKIIQGLYAFLLGFLIGMLKEKTQTILACIAFHVAFNVSGLLIDDFAPENIPEAIQVLLMIVSLAASVFLYLRIKPQKADNDPQR